MCISGLKMVVMQAFRTNNQIKQKKLTKYRVACLPTHCLALHERGTYLSDKLGGCSLKFDNKQFSKM
jgi:hypothetical protein